MAVVVPNALALGSIVDGSLMVASDERNNFTAVQVGVNGLIAMFAVAPTKGDLIVSAGGGSFDKLGVGANRQAIVADSTQPLGVKWGPAYEDYTPTWTAAGTPPAIGNSSVVARYMQIGKMVHAYGKITFGTTATFGTSAWAFALPVNSAAVFSGLQVAGSGFLTNGTTEGIMTPNVATATMAFQYGATYLGNGLSVGQGAPYTWASGYVISWNIVYEAA
jgi:hypothetical protein